MSTAYTVILSRRSALMDVLEDDDPLSIYVANRIYADTPSNAAKAARKEVLEADRCELRDRRLSGYQIDSSDYDLVAVLHGHCEVALHNFQDPLA